MLNQPCSLHIENLAGIRKLSLTVRPITVLIGPQSVGKSVTAKVLYALKSLPWEIFDSAFTDADSKLEKRLGNWFSTLLPTPTHAGGRSLVSLQANGQEIRLTNPDPTSEPWKVHIPSELEDLYGAIRAEAINRTGLSEEEDSIRSAPYRRKAQLQQFFIQGLEKIFGPSGCTRTRFIPAGRAFYSQIERDPASFFKSAALDPFMSEFGTYWSSIKHGFFRRRSVDTLLQKEAASLVEELLTGSFVREGQRDFIAVKDGRKLPAQLWSSGQQEVLPLAYVLSLYAGNHFTPHPRRLIFVEEPEAHLFPSSQRAIVALLALAFNACRTRLEFFITTHSPYVLSTLNVLLKAGALYSRERSKLKTAGIKQIVPRSQSLKAENVAAFYMNQDGCESIMDEETMLIDGRAIDDVSGELAEQFEALSSLE